MPEPSTPAPAAVAGPFPGGAGLLRRGAAVVLACVLLQGCAVVAAVDVAASAAVGVAGLAVDATVGTARVGGKLIGAGVDAALGSDESPDDD